MHIGVLAVTILFLAVVAIAVVTVAKREAPQERVFLRHHTIALVVGAAIALVLYVFGAGIEISLVMPVILALPYYYYHRLLVRNEVWIPAQRDKWDTVKTPGRWKTVYGNERLLYAIGPPVVIVIAVLWFVLKAYFSRPQ
ncbi:MAG TPA: hypothetical protein VEJ63_18255 [Planctomycetota bacterium]|nr:hypothetical protein [Planctomycetota bacterium]